MKKYNGIWLCQLTIMGVLFLIINSCRKDDIPVLTTTEISNITSTTAISGGNITSEGGEPIIARGVCWSIFSNPKIDYAKSYFQYSTDGSGPGVFTSYLTGLYPNTHYFVRAYATNNKGVTVYGDEITFNTENGAIGEIIFNPDCTYSSMTDIEGNVYKTIKIGTQIWMAENLKTTKYNDGTSIPLVGDCYWRNLTTPGYCWYNNDSIIYKKLYGAIYNWFTINTGKLAPAGWHVPSEEEWTKLITYLGGEEVAGGKMKESGITHWSIPNESATNESGFTALPSGERYYSDCTFISLCYSASYWGITKDGGTYSCFLGNETSGCCSVSPYQQNGCAVRLVKD